MYIFFSKKNRFQKETAKKIPYNTNKNNIIGLKCCNISFQSLSPMASVGREIIRRSEKFIKRFHIEFLNFQRFIRHVCFVFFNKIMKYLVFIKIKEKRLILKVLFLSALKVNFFYIF